MIDQNALQVFTQEIIAKIAQLLPTIVTRLIGIIILLIIWPKITKMILGGVERVLDGKKVEPLLKSFTMSILKTLLYIVLFFLVIGILGIKATSLLTVLGTAGLAIGLALQGSLTNLAGGVLILFFKPFVKGDYIVSGALSGTVDKIQILYTCLITPDNRVIVIPNGQLANGAITNVSRMPIRRLDLMFSVSYDTSIPKVKEVLNKVAKEHPKVLQDRAFNIRLSVQNASSLDFICRVWVKSEDYWNTKFDFMEIVKEEFDKNNIEIPYNKLDVYTK